MNKLLKNIFLIYFITHIPITISLDLQVIFGDFYPNFLKNLQNWYIETYKDRLIEAKPLWFRSFIWAEFIFQMPFFFIAIYCIVYEKNWIRIPSIIYGVHVATTVWPILAEIIFSNSNTQLETIVLLSFYTPYFLIPLILAAYMSLCVPFNKKKEN